MELLKSFIRVLPRGSIIVSEEGLEIHSKKIDNCERLDALSPEIFNIIESYLHIFKGIPDNMKSF